jgi:tropomyosin
MNQLRLDADTATAKVDELQAKIKALEQENLSKEQEITSLQHKNSVLEEQVEKLEGDVDKHKKLADEGSGSITQNETLQRRLQLLEEEAEEADKTLREANEKYVRHTPFFLIPGVIPLAAGTTPFSSEMPQPS